jgi:DNA-binding transcriptional ArsR family regulator
MADILPSRSDPPDDGGKEPRVVGIDSDGVETLLSAISSDTARSILAELHEEPATPSEVADRAETSIQNAQYHLGKLTDAGLVEGSGTAYSEKGREMTVYAPADRALVVVAGQEDDASGLRSALSRLLGGLGVVALGSAVVDRLARGEGTLLPFTAASGGASGDGASGGGVTEQSVDVDATAANETATAEPTAVATQSSGGSGFSVAEVTPAPEATQTAASTPTPSAGAATETVRATVEAGAPAGVDPLTALSATVASLSPGELFFLGGVVALATLSAFWWVRN